MFWKKLILINIVVLYISLKVFLLISSQLKKNYLNNIHEDKDLKDLNSSEILCNITNIFETNKFLAKSFDKLRVNFL